MEARQIIGAAFLVALFPWAATADDAGIFIQGQPVGCRCEGCNCGPDCRCAGECRCAGCRSEKGAVVPTDPPVKPAEPSVWLVQFSTEDCYWCEVQSPDFDAVGKEYEGKIDFIHTDDVRSKFTTDDMEIRSFPTTIVFVNGVAKARHVGRQTKKQLREIAERWKNAR